jgi:DNA-binding MarR family transcriptional regulator
MTSSEKRLPIGQLLVHLLRLFRSELFTRMQEAGYTELRQPHMHFFGNIDPGGTRLTELAARANMTRPSMAEIVDELERDGWVERVPDPSDGRAKLVRLTAAGRELVREALRNVREMEDDYRRRIGKERFEQACQALQDLLDALDPEVAARYYARPARRESRPRSADG